MSLLSGLGGGNFTSQIFSFATQAALATVTGGASLAVTTALRTVMSSIGQQVIQQIGQQLGLPQPAIDFAQASFAASAGDAAGAATNLQEAGDALADALGAQGSDRNGLQDAIDNAVKTLTDAAKEAAEGEGSEGASGRGGDSFLVAFAKALGRAMDSKMKQMVDISKKIDQETKAANDGERSPIISELSAKLSALGQEVSFISQATNNSIKSIGEAASALARKQ